MADSPERFDDLLKEQQSAQPPQQPEMFDDLAAQQSAPQQTSPSPPGASGPVNNFPKPAAQPEMFDDVQREAAPQQPAAQPQQPQQPSLQDQANSFVNQLDKNRLPDAQAAGVPSAGIKHDQTREDTIKNLYSVTAPYRSAVVQLGIAAKNNPSMTPDQISAVLDSIDARYPDAVAVIQNPREWAQNTVKTIAAGKTNEQVPGVILPNNLQDEKYTADSGGITYAKEMALKSPGIAGALAGVKAAGAAAPLVSETPGAGLALELGGAALGGFLAQGGAQYLYDNHPEVMSYLANRGFGQSFDFSTPQMRADEAAHPRWALAGAVSSGFLAGRPGIGASLTPHLIGAAMGAGVEAGAEAYSGEPLSWQNIAISAAGNALQSHPWGMSRLFGIHPIPTSVENWSGGKYGEHVTYDPSIVKGQVFTDIGDSADNIFKNHPLVDNEDNRQLLNKAKELDDKGDTIGAGQAINDLTVKTNNGLDVSSARKYISEATADWKNAPDIEIHATPSDADVPAHLGAEQGTLGIFDKDTGKVHIFADQLTSKDDAFAVAYHEMLGHAGLSWKYHDDLDDMLVKFYKTGNSNFRAAVDNWNAANPGAYSQIADPNKRLAAKVEEVLAQKSESGAIPHGYYDILANKIKSFARTIGMDHIKFSDREIKSILSMGHENVVYGDDRTLGLGGLRYIYSGVNATTANTQTLASAKQMIEQGADPEGVRRMTGWHLGDDGGWRFEISDHDFRFNSDETGQSAYDYLKKHPEGMLYAGDVFNHPALFKAYPELAKIPVSVISDPLDKDHLSQGWLTKDNSELVITPYARNPRKTAIHELQHAVQSIEGFAEGGSPSHAIDSIDDEVALNAPKILAPYIGKLVKQRADQASAFMQAEQHPAFQAWVEADRALDNVPSDISNEDLRALLRAEDKARVEAENFYNSQKEHPVAFKDIFRYMRSSSAERNAKLANLLEDGETIHRLGMGLYAAAERGNVASIKEFLKEIPGASYEAYHALYGEVEARDTANRLDMTQGQRAMAKPLSSEGDVLPNEYVFSMPANASRADIFAALDRKKAESVKPSVVKAASKLDVGPEDIVQALDKPPFQDQVRENLKAAGRNPEDFDKTLPLVKSNPPTVSESVRNARRTRNPGFDDRSSKWYDKHLSPDLADSLHGIVKNLPQERRVPDEETIATALDYGIDMDAVREMGPAADNSAYIVAMGDLLRDTGVQVRDLARQVWNKGGVEAEVNLVKKLADFTELAQIFKKSGSNIGRMLRAFKIKIDNFGEDYTGITEALGNFELGDGTRLTSENIREMARRISEANDAPAAIRKEADRFDPDWKKYATSLYYNGLLGTWSVQKANAVGNTYSLFQNLVNDSIGAVLGEGKGLVRKARGLPDTERMTLREAGERWKGVASALVNPELYRSVVREFTAPVGSAHINKFQSQSIQNVPASIAIEGSGRALQAADAFYRGVMESVSMHGLAYRQAAKEALDKYGGTFGSHTDYISERVPQIMDAPSSDYLKQIQSLGQELTPEDRLRVGIKKAAGEEAERQLFQTNLTPNMKALAKLRDFTIYGLPVGRVLAPVVTVSSNILHQAEEFTTVPAIKRLLAKDKNGNPIYTGAERDRQMARILMGAGVTGLAITLASSDSITGLGPSDPKERTEWLLSHEPQAMRIDGEWKSYKNLEPAATFLTILTDTVQESERGWKKLNSKGVATIPDGLLNIASAFGNAVLSNSFMQTMANTLGDGSNMAQKVVYNLVVPMSRLPIVSEANTLSDPYRRDLRGVNAEQSIMNRVKSVDPQVYTQGGRESLPIKVDSLGRMVSRNPSAPSDDPVVQELGRLFDNTDTVIVGAPSTTKHGVPVPPDVYNAHQMIVGPVIYNTLKTIMNSPDYKNYTDDQKAEVLKSAVAKVRDRYGKLLDAQMLARDPTYAQHMLTPLKQSFAQPTGAAGEQQ